MRCLGCGVDNKMLLMDVLRGDTMKAPVIQHQIYMCSACRHIARRLVFRRAEVLITHSSPISVDTLWNERVAAPRTWRNAVEKLHSRQIDIKERAAQQRRLLAGRRQLRRSAANKPLLRNRQPAPLQPPRRARSQRFERGRSPTSPSANTRRQVETERLRSLEIDHKSYLGGAKQNPKPPAEPAFSSYEHREDKR